MYMLMGMWKTSSAVNVSNMKNQGGKLKFSTGQLGIRMCPFPTTHIFYLKFLIFSLVFYCYEKNSLLCLYCNWIES